MSKEKELEALQRATRSSGLDEIARISELTGASEYEDMRRGALETNVIAARRRFREAGQAGKQLLTMGFEAVGAIPEGATAAYTETINKEAQEFAKTPYARGGTVGQVLADVVMALPALVIAGPAVTTIRGASALGAIEGLTRPAYTQRDLNLLNPERVRNVSVSALAAGGSTLLMSRLLPSTTYAVHEKMSSSPFSFAKNRSIEGIQKEAAEEAVDSAKIFNSFVTPAEATKDQIARTREANISLFSESGRKLLTKIQNREEQLLNSINAIVKGVVPEGRTAAQNTSANFADTAYRTLIDVEDGISGVIKGNKILERSYKAITKTNARKAFTQRSGGRVDIQPNTVGELHLMRLHLDELISSAKSQKAPIAGLSQARRDLLSIADTYAPEYALKRNIDQRLILQDKLFASLNKAKDSDIATENFYKAFLQTPEKRSALLAELDNVTDKPVADMVKANIEAITPVLRALNDSPLYQALGIRQLEPRVAVTGGLPGLLINNATSIVNGVLDKYVIDFITNPNWIEEFSKRAANKSEAAKNRIMMEAFYDYIGRVSPPIASSLQFANSTNELQEQLQALN